MSEYVTRIITKEEKRKLALAWLEDQIAMTAPDTVRYTMYLTIRELIVNKDKGDE